MNDFSVIIQKEKIHEVLEMFADTDALEQAADALVKTLGYYNSHGGISYSPAQLFDTLPDTSIYHARRLEMRRKFCEIVKNVYIIAQTTAEEIKSSLQTDKEQYLLFIAIETYHDKYKPIVYKKITQLLADHLPMSIVVFFYGGNFLNISFSRKYQRKRLARVFILPNIDYCYPNQKHLDVLYELSLPAINTHLAAKISFSILYKQWEEALNIDPLTLSLHNILDHACKNGYINESTIYDYLPDKMATVEDAVCIIINLLEDINIKILDRPLTYDEPIVLDEDMFPDFNHIDMDCQIEAAVSYFFENKSVRSVFRQYKREIYRYKQFS